MSRWFRHAARFPIGLFGVLSLAMLAMGAPHNADPTLSSVLTFPAWFAVSAARIVAGAMGLAGAAALEWIELPLALAPFVFADLVLAHATRGGTISGRGTI